MIQAMFYKCLDIKESCKTISMKIMQGKYISDAMQALNSVNN